MQEAKTAIRYIKRLDNQAELVNQLRDYAKTEGGRMTEFGRNFLSSAKDSEIKQSFVAKLLDITPGAVSQHYNK